MIGGLGLKIEPLDRQTIKIVLSKSDMQQMSIEFEQMDYSQPATKRMIMQLLQQARDETNLDFTKGKLLIEAFPTPDGGCVLYLNLIQRSYSTNKNNRGFNTPLIFKIQNLDQLCIVSKKLYQNYHHLILKSTLYSENNQYILMVYSYYKLDDKLIAIINEHGSLVGKGEIKSRLIEEHTHLIVKNKAIETICEYLC